MVKWSYKNKNHKIKVDLGLGTNAKMVLQNRNHKIKVIILKVHTIRLLGPSGI